MSLSGSESSESEQQAEKVAADADASTDAESIDSAFFDELSESSDELTNGRKIEVEDEEAEEGESETAGKDAILERGAESETLVIPVCPSCCLPLAEGVILDCGHSSCDNCVNSMGQFVGCSVCGDMKLVMMGSEKQHRELPSHFFPKEKTIEKNRKGRRCKSSDDSCKRGSIESPKMRSRLFFLKKKADLIICHQVCEEKECDMQCIDCDVSLCAKCCFQIHSKVFSFFTPKFHSYASAGENDATRNFLHSNRIQKLRYPQVSSGFKVYGLV